MAVFANKLLFFVAVVDDFFLLAVLVHFVFVLLVEVFVIIIVVSLLARGFLAGKAAPVVRKILEGYVTVFEFDGKRALGLDADGQGSAFGRFSLEAYDDTLAGGHVVEIHKPDLTVSAIVTSSTALLPGRAMRA